MTTQETWTVGQVAAEVGVSIRTLHHYDEIGLVVPGGRSLAGYRLYTPADLARLRHVVVYRRLGFGLEEIAALLHQDADVVGHLRRQRASVTDRIGQLHELTRLIDAALEDEMNDNQVSTEEMRRIFGDDFDDDYAVEAEQRWGDTEAWTQSRERAAGYTAQQWQQVKDEQDDLNARFVAAMREGRAPDSATGTELAEEARQQICRWFYDCPREMHAAIAQMYVTDPRFTQTYEDIAPGLAQYVHDAVVANAARG